MSNLCTVYVVSKGVYILSKEKLPSASDTERNEILRDTGSERSSSCSSGSGTISGSELFKQRDSCMHDWKYCIRFSFFILFWVDAMSSTNALKSKSLGLSNKRLQHLPTIVRGVSGRVETDSDETRSVCSDAPEEVSKIETSYTFDDRKDGNSHISSNPEYENVTDPGEDYFTDDQVGLTFHI